MTNLRSALDDYLRLRRHLGFRLERDGQLLPGFIEFVEAAGADRVTTTAALAWAMSPAGAHPAWWATRLGIVRGFARYLQALDPIHEVPPMGLLPTRRPRTTPYIYSDDDVRRLIDAAQGLVPSYRAALYETLVGLLHVTGMRLGEALGLARGDVDLVRGRVSVRQAKFNKDRQLPVHATTVAALARYSEIRDQHWPEPATDAFFLSARGLRLGSGTVHDVFRGLIRKAGLEGDGARGRPRPHAFRHSFAVTSLVNFYRTDEHPEARLPVLSTFLGHVDPGSTYWYLQAAPELLCLAAQRLETVWTDRP